MALAPLREGAFWQSGGVVDHEKLHDGDDTQGTVSLLSTCIIPVFGTDSVLFSVYRPN